MLYFMQMQAVNAALGRKVASLRKIHGMSQAELAEQFGQLIGKPLDPTAITRLEQGRRPVAVHELLALAQVLRVEATIFFKFLGPLDDAANAMEYQVQGLEARARLANIELEAARVQQQALAGLQAFRETKDPEGLIDGMQLLYTLDKFERANWRDLLLDAGVPDAVIADALAEVPGAEQADSLSEERIRLGSAIIRGMGKPRRRKK